MPLASLIPDRAPRRDPRHEHLASAERAKDSPLFRERPEEDQGTSDDVGGTVTAIFGLEWENEHQIECATLTRQLCDGACLSNIRIPGVLPSCDCSFYGPKIFG